MKPLRIYLKNFMNHNLSEIDCTGFNSFLIIGKNNKNDRISNGVGKTTIFRAIEYALFNQSHAQTLDKIVKDGKKKAVVEFDFELKGIQYRIYRHRTSTGSSDVRLYQKNIANEWESVSQRTPSATDDKIKDLIKITHKAFTYSVLFRQADLTGISSVDDPKKRKEILKEPLNLVQYSKLEEIAVKKFRPIKKDIERIENSILMLGNPNEDINKSIAELSQCDDSIQQNTNEINNNQNTISLLQKNIEEIKISLNYEDIDIHNKINTQENKIKLLNKSIKQYNDEFKNIINKISSIDLKVISSKELIEEKEKQLFEINNIEVRDITDVENDIKKFTVYESKGSSIIAEIKTEIRMIQRTLPESDQCPACSQSITKGYRKQVEEDIRNSLAKKQEELKSNEQKLLVCSKKLSEFQKESSIARKKLSDFSKIENELSLLKKDITSSDDSLTSLNISKTKVQSSIQDDESNLKQSIDLFEQLKEIASKSNLSNLNNKIFSLNKEIELLTKSINSFQSIISNLMMNKGSLQEKISKRKDDNLKIESFNNQLKDLRTESKIYQMVVDSFSYKGIPTFIIKTILTDLQNEVNIALKQIRPELDIQIDHELNIEYRRNGSLRDYSQLSYGQHVYIALAFKRGLSRVIQKRIGVDINILEFDEVDSNLDEAGVDAFAEAITKWQKDFTIFVISHKKEIKDKFNHAILVEEGDNGSEAKLVSTW